MKAGRDLDLKVAKALGWKVSEGDGIFFDEEGHVIDEPKFSTSWEGMGVLVEEARKQGIYLDMLPQEKMFICEAKTVTNFTIGSANDKEAPYAACLAFLKANGIAV